MHKAEGSEYTPLLEFFGTPVRNVATLCDTNGLAFTPEPLSDDDQEKAEEQEEEEEEEDWSDGYDSDPQPSSPPRRRPLTPIRPPELISLPNTQDVSGSDTGIIQTSLTMTSKR